MVANVTVQVTDNILPQVLNQIRTLASDVLTEAGEEFKYTARMQCPVSATKEPGYVHLRDTIDYEVSQRSTFFQQWVIFFVGKYYATFVNNGTSRMAPRPFFTNGVLAVSDHIDDVVERVFRSLMLGHVENRR